MEHTASGIVYSTSKEKLHINMIHDYLSNESYWSKKIPIEVVGKAIENSLCFGAYHDGNQIAFARVVTDYSTFGYLADVFVIESYRGRGISKQLMRFIMKEVDQFKLRRMMLATLDAHTLYQQFEFEPLKDPTRFMEISHPHIYGDLKNTCE